MIDEKPQCREKCYRDADEPALHAAFSKKIDAALKSRPTDARLSYTTTHLGYSINGDWGSLRIRVRPIWDFCGFVGFLVFFESAWLQW